MQETTSEIIKKEQPLVPAFDVSKGQLPDLHSEQVFTVPFALESEYWSPEVGEVKMGFIQACEIHQFPKRDNASIMVDVECIKLLEQLPDGTIQNVINGSKRLVDLINTFLKSGKLVPGNPLQITYTGKKKNKTNSNESNTWQVKPIAIKGGNNE